MKNLLALASIVLLSAGSAVANDGQVADQTLAKMGLGDMKVMTDAEGTQVRGMAYVKVSGYSRAFNKNARTYNDYVAKGYHKADGGSFSDVYSSRIKTFSFGPFTKSFDYTRAAGAIGGANAHAH